MKGYRNRRRMIREPFNVIVIVCEGLETEPSYLRGFTERYCRLNIEPLHSGGTDARSIVEYAIQQANEYQLNYENGDEIWCVFDVDDKRDEDIRNYIERANTNNINVALSNPCFEFWYLLHFMDRQASIDREDVGSLLRGFIDNYEKSIFVNHLLLDKLDDAIQRAKRLIDYHRSEGVELNSRRSNPSTQVFLLIENIRRLKERNMRG